jgi:hypothetical protein
MLENFQCNNELFAKILHYINNKSQADGGLTWGHEEVPEPFQEHPAKVRIGLPFQS